MISAAIVGLGRWGQALVAAVHGKSSRIRFVRGVVRDAARDFAARHGLVLTTAIAEAVRDPSIEAVFLATPLSLMPSRWLPGRRPEMRCGAKSRWRSPAPSWPFRQRS